MKTIDNKAWYSVKVLSGKEEKTISAINLFAATRGLQDFFGEMFVAKAVRQIGDKKTSTNLYPGYIFINVSMSTEVKDIISNTRNVIGFIGDKKNPTPISQPEIDKIINSMGIAPKQGSEMEKVRSLFSEGDKVRVLRLGVEGFVKKIEDLKITVTTNIFDRNVDTIVFANQLEKI